MHLQVEVIGIILKFPYHRIPKIIPTFVSANKKLSVRNFYCSSFEFIDDNKYTISKFNRIGNPTEQRHKLCRSKSLHRVIDRIIQNPIEVDCLLKTEGL